MPRRENARDKILEAAEALVVEKGVDALTMDTVAMMAGLGKGGVLHHFRYKVDLMEGMIERHLSRAAIMLSDEGNESDEDIYDWIDTCIDYVFGEEGELHRTGLAIFAAAAQYPRLMEPIRKFHELRQKEMLSRAQDPELASILMLATDGYGVFTGLGLPPIDESQKEGVRTRLHAIVESMRVAENQS